MHSAWQLATSIGQLIKSWWRQDRIRIARNCGALLRLQPSDRVLIGDQLFIVVQRKFHGEIREPMRDSEAIEYLLCEPMDEPHTCLRPPGLEATMGSPQSAKPIARLIVPIAPSNAAIALYHREVCSELLDDDCVILPRNDRASML